jgi:hypothetical protein
MGDSVLPHSHHPLVSAYLSFSDSVAQKPPIIRTSFQVRMRGVDHGYAIHILV